MKKQQITEQEIRNQLAQCHGSENHFFNKLFPNLRYTDGVREVCILCESYWLLTDVLAHCTNLCKKEEFITIELFKVKDQDSCIIKYTDGNDNQLAEQQYKLTDFPLNNTNQIIDNEVFTHPAIKFYFCNKVLLLPSEY